MSYTYLPGDTRQRIQDLLKNRNISQAELAGSVGLSESALSRYLQGRTKHLGDGFLLRIAKYFDVSADFLLGETDLPDRKNFDILELGLSAEAAKLLYTGKVDAEILNLLLEHPRFPQLLTLLKRYRDDTLASGILAMNQNLSFLSSILMEQGRNHPEDTAAAALAASELRQLRSPIVQVDQTAIQTLFLQIIRDLKQQTESHRDEMKTVNKETLDAFRTQLVKGQDSFDFRSLTPETVADAVVQMAAGSELPEEWLSELKGTLVKIFSDARDPNHDE